MTICTSWTAKDYLNNFNWATGVTTETLLSTFSIFFLLCITVLEVCLEGTHCSSTHVLQLFDKKEKALCCIKMQIRLKYMNLIKKMISLLMLVYNMLVCGTYTSYTFYTYMNKMAGEDTFFHLMFIMKVSVTNFLLHASFWALT